MFVLIDIEISILIFCGESAVRLWPTGGDKYFAVFFLYLEAFKTKGQVLLWGAVVKPIKDSIKSKENKE